MMFFVMVLLLPHLNLPVLSCLRLSKQIQLADRAPFMQDVVTQTGNTDKAAVETALRIKTETSDVTTDAKGSQDLSTAVSAFNATVTPEVAGTSGNKIPIPKSEGQEFKRPTYMLESQRGDTDETVPLIRHRVKDIVEHRRRRNRRNRKGRGRTRKRKNRPVNADWKRYVKKLLKEYETFCGEKKVKAAKLCDGILQKVKNMTKSQLDLPQRQPKYLIASRFLCGTFTPFQIDWYNPLTQLCCNGIQEKVSGQEICCDDKVVNETESIGCCGMETYNKTTQLCCNNFLFNKTTDTQNCCGSEMYDVQSSRKCCNKRIYDSESQYCCDNRAIYDNIGIRNNYGRCCGEQSYDERCFSCNETLKERPTIYELYNPTTEICCHGRIAVIAGNKTSCCGRKLMDRWKYICVNNSFVRRPSTTAVYIHRVQSKSFIVRSYNQSSGTEFQEKDKNVKTTPASVVHRVVIIIGAGIVSIIGASVSIFCMKRRCSNSRKNHENNSENSRTHLNEIGPFSSEDESVLQHSLQNTIRNVSSVNYDSFAYNTELYMSRECSTNETDSLSKTFTVDPKNLASELFRDVETQTRDIKRSNLRDVFGNKYQYDCYLDRFNRTVTWDRSDTKLTLPESAVENHKVEVHASSFYDIPSINAKFSLPLETRLASPVAEFRLPGVRKLKDFAVVEIPIVGNPDQLEVWKCPSDEGMYQTVECDKVPVYRKENNGSDLFYCIDGGKVRVYTKSFSVFFCTCLETSARLCLRAFLFGSFKKILEKMEVRISLYIADELLKFKDYQQRMMEIEHNEERELKREQELHLYKEIKGDDILELNLGMPENLNNKWIPKQHPTKKIPIESMNKRIEFHQLAKGCNPTRTIPYQASWYLERPATHSIEVVQCTVDISCRSSDSSVDPLLTTLFIDELWLRAKDRKQAPTNQETAMDLKDYLMHHLLPPEKILMNEEIKSKINIRRRDRGEDRDFKTRLDTLYNDTKPEAFIRTVAFILEDLRLDGHLDRLEQRKTISKIYLKRAYQECSDVRVKEQVHGSPATCALADGAEGEEPCRCELGTIAGCSFDDRNHQQGHSLQAADINPRPELSSENMINSDDMADNSETALKVRETSL